MATPREYIEIRPTTDELHPGGVRRSIERLAALVDRHTDAGIRARLRGTTHSPAIEWLLASDGADDTRIRWLVGVTDPTLLEGVDDHLRSMLPTAYELARVEFCPQAFLERHTTTAEDHTPPVAGVTLQGHTRFGRDWLLPLHAPAPRPGSPSRRQGTMQSVDRTRFPLTNLVERLTDTTSPVIYQVMCRPHGPWRAEADAYQQSLEDGQVTLADQLLHTLLTTDHPERPIDEPPKRYRERLSLLETRGREGFVVAARAVVAANTQLDADQTAHRLADGLDDLSVAGRYHRIEGAVVTDATIFEQLLDRHLPAPTYETRRWPWVWKRGRSDSLRMTAAELPSLCAVDGSRLTPHGERALATRPDERTGLPLPPPAQLEPYREGGMNLGIPLTHDRRSTQHPISLPEAFQNRHVVIAGASGAGKSVTVSELLRSNTQSVGGSHILLDSKGTDTSLASLRTHYAEHGTLDDVRYFDLTETLPALSLFDIRPLLDAGVGREEARSRVANQYVELLVALMGPDRFHSAVHAGDVIRHHVRALFDPVYGDDSFSHHDLMRALADTRTGSPPAVTDDALEAYFEELLNDSPTVFKKKVGGAISRVGRVDTDARLRPLFDATSADSVPDSDRDAPDSDEDYPSTAASNRVTPSFSFESIIDSDVTVVFDFGGMDTHIKNALTIAILSGLWRALTIRAESTRHAATDGSPSPTERSLVNLVMEEAGEVAATDLVDTLLREGRSFGLSMCLGVQYPAQLRTTDPDRDTYHELLNEVATFVVGNVTVDTDLAKALATDAMPPEQVATRLRALSRGEWLVRLASPFGADPPRPFLVESCPPPVGHPDGPSPLSASEAESFERAFATVRETTARHHGFDHSFEHATVDEERRTEHDLSDLTTRTSLLPHTSRLPDAVRYNQDAHALHCTSCHNRFAPTTDGMRRAIECCHSLATVDRDDVPPCRCHMTLTLEEIEATPYSLQQLRFLQVVYDAQQRRLDRLSYDIVTDSMVRLREYAGVSVAEVDELVDDGVLRRERTYPSLVYTVPAETRSLLGESYQKGLDFGDGLGDLTESAEHVRLVEAGARWARTEYVDDPAHPGRTVARYHELDDGRRLDCAVLDDAGEILVGIEAERVNNDLATGAPADFDTFADCEVSDAIWVVNSRSDGHAVLDALTNPRDGVPRVTKAYSESTPPEQWRIDTPGLTEMYTLSTLLNRLEADEAETD